MTPVPRSMDNHNPQHLMNMQSIRQPPVTSRIFSGDSAIANNRNYGCDTSPHGPKEGQCAGDSKDLEEKGPSNNISSLATSSATQTPFTTTSNAAVAHDPVKDSYTAAIKNKLAEMKKQDAGTRVHNQYQFVPSTTMDSKNLEEKGLSNFTIILNAAVARDPIKNPGMEEYNKRYANTLVHNHSSIVTPPMSHQAIKYNDASNAAISSAGRVGVALQSHSKSNTNMVHEIGDGSLPLANSSIVGIKRKVSPTMATENFSPAGGPLLYSSSSIPLSRRDSLPMEVRYKKMKATDCLLFAANLLEQAASSNDTSSFVAAPANVLSCIAKPSTMTKTKPMKKMVCEKVERSLKEAIIMQQIQQEQQQEDEDGDTENKPKEADVLCGRGGKVNKHPGNIVYRKVVEYNKSYYQSVHKKHRILVSQSIVKAILNYGGRFMGQKGHEWSPICFKKAVQKTSQALRERSNTSDVLQGVQRLVGVAEI